VSGFFKVHTRFSRCYSWTHGKTDLFGEKNGDNILQNPLLQGADIVGQIFHEHYFEIAMGT
jgi:hypothetical protein